MHFIGCGLEPAEEAPDAVPVSGVPEFLKIPGGAAFSLDDKSLLILREFIERNFQWNPVLPASFFQVLLALFKAGGLPRFDDSSSQCEVAIGQSQALIDFDDSSKSSANGTGTQGMIKGEESGGRIMKVPFIAGAEIAIRVEMDRGRFFEQGNGEDPFAVTETGGNGFGQSGFPCGGDGEAVLDDMKKEILFLFGLLKSQGECLKAAVIVRRWGFPSIRTRRKPCRPRKAVTSSAGVFLGKGMRKRNQASSSG
jgi:hypothetical protein